MFCLLLGRIFFLKSNTFRSLDILLPYEDLTKDILRKIGNDAIVLSLKKIKKNDKTKQTKHLSTKIIFVDYYITII